MRRNWAIVLAVMLATVSLAGCMTDEADQDPHAKVMEAAREASQDLDTTEKALEAGYEPAPFCVPGMGVHWANHALLDTELDPSQPEVVLFEPSTSNFTDPDTNRFLGVEYVAVTEDTEHNSSDNVPTLLGQPLDGPMAGHEPGMPWHADLHVYLAEDVESTSDFENERPDTISCPEGTTPPPPGEDGGAQAQVEFDVIPPESVHRTVEASVSWTVENADSVDGTAVHWAEESVEEPSAEAYGNTSEGTEANGTYTAPVSVPGAPNASGTLHLRVHAQVDGEEHWSPEVSVPIEALEANEVTMQNLAYDPAELEVTAPAYVVWTNEGTLDHTVTFEQLNGTEDFELADLAPGEQAGWVFTETGTFEYRCTYHSDDYGGTGMTANVTVTAGE